MRIPEYVPPVPPRQPSPDERDAINAHHMDEYESGLDDVPTAKQERKLAEAAGYGVCGGDF